MVGGFVFGDWDLGVIALGHRSSPWSLGEDPDGLGISSSAGIRGVRDTLAARREAPPAPNCEVPNLRRPLVLSKDKNCHVWIGRLVFTGKSRGRWIRTRQRATRILAERCREWDSAVSPRRRQSGVMAHDAAGATPSRFVSPLARLIFMQEYDTSVSRPAGWLSRSSSCADMNRPR